MSAYVVNIAHIDYLVHAALRLVPDAVYFASERVEYGNADQVGAALLAENIASVQHRYPNDAPDELPGPVPTPQPPTYRYYSHSLPNIDPVKVLVAISGYEYQSCEHPGWATSAAHDFCEALRGATIRRLPGYDDAGTWSVERVSVQDRIAKARAAANEPTPDPLDDFNYVGSRHHY